MSETKNSISKKNRLGRFLLILVCIITVVLIITYSYINTASFRENVKSFFVAELENLTGKNIKIDSADTISFRTLHFSNLEILEKNGDDDEVLLQAKKLEIKFALFFPFWKGKTWQLDIRDIAFTDLSTSITRNRSGEFDLLKKLGIDLTFLNENIKIERVSFKNSSLVYHDEMVYHYELDALTTKAENVSGYFDFSTWPKTTFTLQGMGDKDDALLSFSGFFFTQKREYSLDFHLRNADLTHFKYYLEAAEQLNVSRGKFDLDLNLSISPESINGELDWQGKAVFYEGDAQPFFLNEIPFRQINGEINFIKPEITVSGLNGLYGERPFQLEGLLLTQPELYFNLNIIAGPVNAALLKDDLSLFMGEYKDFSIQGEVDLSANVQGFSGAFDIQGTVTTPEIMVENLTLPNITANFLLKQEELIINSLKSESSEGSVSVVGKLDWTDNSPFYHFEIETSHLSFQNPLFRQLSNLEEFSGNIDSSFLLENEKRDNDNENNILNLTGKFTINNPGGNDFSLPDPLKGDIKAAFDLSDNVLSIEQCKLSSGKIDGFLRGKLQLAEVALIILDWEAQISDLSQFSNVLELEAALAGRAKLQGKIKGNWLQPEIDMELNLSDFSIQDYQIEEITGKLSYRQGILSVPSYTLTNHDLKLSGEGKIALSQSERPEISLSYQIEPFSLESVLGTLNYNIPLTGQTSGNGHIKGIWPELKVNGALTLTEIVYQDYPLGQGKADFLLQPEKTVSAWNQSEESKNILGITGYDYVLNLEQLQLQNETLQLRAKGQVKVGAEYPFSLETEFSQESFLDIVDYLYPTENLLRRSLPSRVNGVANLTGNSKEQHLSLSALLTPQQQEENPPSRLEALLIFDQQGVNISNLKLIQSEGVVQAQGRISTSGDLDINFQADELDMAELMNTVQIEEEVRGIANIRGSCTGTLEQPNISLTAQIKKGYFREFQFQDLQSELLWNSIINQIEVKKLSIALEKGYQITAHGNIPVDSFTYNREEEIDLSTAYRELPLNFEIKMEETDLNLLKMFWPDTFSEISGIIDLKLSFIGTTTHPVINGSISIRKGLARLNDFPVQIGEINNTIAIKNNKVTIPPLHFRAYENRFSLSGEFVLTGLLPDSITLEIKNEDKKVVYQDVLESEADLKLEISNLITSPHISGHLFLSNGTFHINNLLKLEEGMVFPLPQPLAAARSNGQDQLEIDIELLDSFKLKMVNAEIEIGGKIRLGGSLTDPVPQGTITLKKGVFIYFDKRFSITDGLVTINGANPYDIDLNARAYTNVQNVRININVLGSLASPQILLSSQPNLKETEIISLLAFNRNIQGLSEGEINQILSQEMVGVLLQNLQLNLFNLVERKLATGLGLEFIKISYNGESNGSSPFIFEDLHLADLTLEVGKNIGDDLFITYSTPLSFKGEKSLGMDFQLSPDFTFTTQFDTDFLKKQDYKIRFGLEIRF